MKREFKYLKKKIILRDLKGEDNYNCGMKRGMSMNRMESYEKYEEEIKNIIADIRRRMTFNGRKRIFEQKRKLLSVYLEDEMDPEEFTKKFIIEKIFELLNLEVLPEKHFRTVKGKRKVDYKVKNLNNKMFLVEAKPINTDLYEKGDDGAVNQIKGLFRLAEVKENYNFGVATDGLIWIFIDKNGEETAKLDLLKDHDKIKDFLVGKERVISQKSEEEITKRFYDWYNALLHGGRYKNKEGKIDWVSEKDCLVNNIFNVQNSSEKEQIAQSVVNRLIFIKFLQSKEIIEKDILAYLSHLSEDILNEKLKQLFFRVLNTPKNERIDIDPNFEDIPYLNGSLFIKTEVERENPDYRIKAEILKKIIKFLDSFRFIHKETFENGDSIDPEILGYIFERAMTSSDRKGTGAYYTPKQITKYIAENTIYPCLIDKINTFLKEEKGYKETELIKNINDIFILHETTLNEIWNKIILNLKVCDNACGSGAFLLAAGNILFDLSKKICKKLNMKNPDPVIKKMILLKNLYGVDINPNAVEIAKLRLWLWLVDSYDPEHIQPLPNIEYNLRSGNTLLGYVDISRFKDIKSSDLEYWTNENSLYDLLEEREKLIKTYKGAKYTELKKVRIDLEEIDKKIKRLLDFEFYKEIKSKKIEITREDFDKLKPFHWGFEFFEVFDPEKPEEERGFDVIIGNPPYVSAWEMEKSDVLSRKILPKLYSDKFQLKSHWDLYIPFILQSTNIAKNEGYFSYILPNPICREKYATDIRKYILKNSTIKRLLTAGERNVFVGVSRQSIVIVLKLMPSIDKENEIIVQFIDENNNIKTINKIQQKVWYDLHQSQFRYESDSTTMEIIEKMNKTGIRLGNIYYINLGAQMYSRKKGEFGKQYLLTKDPKENPKKFFEGKDITRYGLKYRNLYMDYLPELMYDGKCIELFESPKLITRQISGKNESLIFTLDKNGFYCDHNLILATDYKNLKPEDRTKFKGYDIIEDHNYTPEFILCILNSKLMSFFYRNVYATGSLQGSYSHVYPKHVRDFPLPNFEEIDEKIISSVSILCNYMLFLNRTEERRKSEKELIEFIDRQVIDSLVYELYFKEKLETNLLQLIEPYLKDIENLDSDEEKLETIKEIVKRIKADDKITKEIEKIKSHEWVKVIEKRSL